MYKAERKRWREQWRDGGRHLGEDYYTNQCDGKLYNGRNCNDPNTKNITNTNTIKNTNTL